MKWTLPVLVVFLAVETILLRPARTTAGEAAIQIPAAVWPAGPLELVMAFPGAIDLHWSQSLVGKTIAYFDPVQGSGGRPAMEAPLGSLHIAGVKLADQGRTLVLATDPHPRVARYELSLGPGREPGRLISYDLSGLEAAWSPAKDDAGAEPVWKGWWPDIDLELTRRLTRGSTPHERGFALFEQPGRLTLSSLLRLAPGESTVRIEASGVISDVTLGDEQPVAEPSRRPDGTYEVTVLAHAKDLPLFLGLSVETGGSGRPLMLRAFQGNGKARPRQPIERQRFSVSWAPFSPGSAASAPVPIPDLAGGNVRRGETLFFSDQARCSQCHAFGGKGGTVGPDLTQIGRKGSDHVYRSIAAPNAEIASEFIPYTIATHDGRVHAGVVRAEGAGAIRVIDTNARTTILRRDEITEIRPSGTSIMPVGLAGGLGESGLRDLIAYLTASR